MSISDYLKEQYGIWRSRVIYYGKPFNGRRLRSFYRQFVGAGDLCFDIGAHVGNRTEAFLKLGARVIAIEPQPQCIRFLEKQFEQNDHCTIVPKAAGAVIEEKTFFINQKNPTISTLASLDWRRSMDKAARQKEHWDKEVEVSVTTLDALIAEYGLPQFIKIDVEGLEYQVLKGLSQPISCLSFEYITLDLDAALKCIDYLSALGPYQFNWSEREELKLKSSKWLSGGEMITILRKKTGRVNSGDVYAKVGV